ncbi:MAG: GNAT family N-acetyltransferase [Acidobacteriaceae bacterium]|nr:GNAT family N-acetyltransferase [Acidobacteriaceae bacterium]
MLKFQRITLDRENWDSTLQQFPDRTIYQSLAWLDFLSETQRGEIVIAALHESNSVLGYFTGMIIQRFGLRILGSPFPGWTTAYMGLVLKPEVPRMVALEALQRFAFFDLRCAHLEIMDRKVSTSAVSDRYLFFDYKSFEIDLSYDEDQLFKNMVHPCRRSIRLATREGVVIQEASDAGFVDEFYGQLTDAFVKDKLVPTYGKGRVLALIRHLQPTGNLLLLRALDPDGRCIATLVSVGMHDRAEVWATASWRPYQHLRPNELLAWHSMRYWKSRSVQFLDFGGAGEYKRKYGAHEISVPWIRISRYPVLDLLRSSAAIAVRARQRWLGGLHGIADSVSLSGPVGQAGGVMKPVGGSTRQAGRECGNPTPKPKKRTRPTAFARRESIPE